MGESLSWEGLFGEICAGEGFARDCASDGTRLPATAAVGKVSKTIIKSRYLAVLCGNGIIFRGVKGGANFPSFLQ